MTERKSIIREKMKELDEIIAYFEKEEIDLDKALEKYEKASSLVKDLNEVLKGYELKVNKIA